MKRKTLLFGIICICISAGILGVWLYANRGESTLDEIRARGVLRVGLDASFPPFEYVDEEGRIVGYDTDIARAVADEIGGESLEVQFVNVTYDALYDALWAGRVDVVISGLPYDPRLTEDVAYSHNYFNAGQVLVAPAGSGIDGTEGLAGRRVAVEWGSGAEMEARRLAGEMEEAGGFEIARYQTPVEALEALAGGEAEAAVCDAVSAYRFVGGTGGPFRIVTYLSDEWYAAALRPESRELLALVNRTIDGMRESGELEQIRARWF